MEEYKLFDAEYRLMELVWNLEPVNSTALARRRRPTSCGGCSTKARGGHD